MKFLGWKLFTVSVLLTIPFFIFCITRIVKSQHFEDDCVYHIDQALNGTSGEDSIREIDAAVNYLESHQLTTGFTTITGRDNDEDLSAWYREIKKKSDYIHALQNESPDNIKKYWEFVSIKNYAYRSMRTPPGISIYPHNTFYFIWFITSLALAILGIVGIFVFINEKSY